MTVKVNFRESNSMIHVNMFENENLLSVKIRELQAIPIIPRNYGLITWDGSVLTVS